MSTLRPAVLLWILVCFLLSLTLVVGCGDDDDDHSAGEPDDDDDDDDNDTVDDDDDDDDNDDTSGWDNLSDPLGEGQVRAGIITSDDELIGGPRARGELGDYKIYNSRIELIVRSPQHPGVALTTYSGNIIDADRARPPEEEGADSLLAVEHIVGVVRAFWADSIEVVEDGHDGPAIIRVTGKDGGVQFIDSFVGSGDRPYGIINDYILEPDKDYITIRTTVLNETDRPQESLVVDIPIWRDATDVFAPRAGFSIGQTDMMSNLRWVGGVSRMNLPISYALATIAPEKRMFSPYLYNEILPMVQGFLNLAPNGEKSIDRLLIVGTGDTSMFPEVLNAFDDNVEFGTIQGQLTGSKGSDDFKDVHVLVQDTIREPGSNYVAMLRPDKDGKFLVQADPGIYTVVAKGEGRQDSAPVDLKVWTDTTTMAYPVLNSPGILDFDITDADALPVPCKISLQTGHNADPEKSPARRIWSLNCSDVENVLPGDYTATASRGYEYEIYQENITITAGQTTLFSGSIEHSVDSTGLMSGDFHIHAFFSMDSRVFPQDRIRQMAGEGLEMPVMSEHDVQSHYSQYVQELGAESWVNVVDGSEISPSIGHFNAWPMTQPEGAADYYSLPFNLYDDNMTSIRRHEVPEMHQMARDLYGAQVVQINHPRGGSYFSYVGYNPAVGVGALDPDKWDGAFDSIEVYNGGVGNDQILFDWFSFLDQGLAYTMNGNSDSHGSDTELGNPRNVFAMPTDAPELADQQDMIDSILAQRNQVSSGPLIDFSIEGQSIGGFVTGLKAIDVDLEIRVQAPLWIEVDTLKIYSNHGQVVYEQAIGAKGAVVRFDDTVTLQASQDAYFVVETGHSTGRLGPVNPGGGIRAITNPIWVDVDGNGVFDEPGLP